MLTIMKKLMNFGIYNKECRMNEEIEFDGWEFQGRCKKCNSQSNNDIKQPVSFLDVQTKLCEFCFSEINDEI